MCMYVYAYIHTHTHTILFIQAYVFTKKCNSSQYLRVFYVLEFRYRFAAVVYVDVNIKLFFLNNSYNHTTITTTHSFVAG
jgi:hypothetical protein